MPGKDSGVEHPLGQPLGDDFHRLLTLTPSVMTTSVPWMGQQDGLAFGGHSVLSVIVAEDIKSHFQL